MIKPPAHEKRFDPYNYFPKNLADNKPIRQVDFDKAYPLANKWDDFVYKNVKCSDSLFENEQMDLYKKRKQGILHFTNSVVNRGDEYKPHERLMQFANDNTQACRCRNPGSRVTTKDGP